METDALDLALGEYRRIEGVQVAGTDVVDQFLPLVLQRIDHHRAAHRARGVPADGRFQCRQRHLRQTGYGLDRANRLVQISGVTLVADRHTDQHVCQWTDLGTLAVEGRCLDPGILALVLEVGVLRLGLPLPGVERVAARVPGVLGALGNTVAEVGIVERGDRLERLQVTVGDIPTRQVEHSAFRILRAVRHGQVVVDAATDGRPIEVEGTDRRHIDQVGRFDEVFELVDEVLDQHQALDVEHRRCVMADGIAHPADRDVLDMRALAAKDGDDLVRVVLHVERIHVVRNTEQIHLG